ncbi:hypothetical protein Gotur_022837 [Gossypium turneri]
MVVLKKVLKIQKTKEKVSSEN